MIFNVFGSFAYVLSLLYAQYAEVNQGVITSIFSLTSFLLAVAGVCLFHEKMKSYHYAGILLLVGCAILISVSDDGSKPQTVEIYGHSMNKISPVIAVLMTLLCPILFTAMSVNTRIQYLKLRYDSMDFVMTADLLINPILIIISWFVVPGQGL